MSVNVPPMSPERENLPYENSPSSTSRGRCVKSTGNVDLGEFSSAHGRARVSPTADALPPSP